ncbi:MAG: hypothetical protein KJZ84_16740 [Bryobacteraceae bacterium]|nr:hypothetical protein [Bryobacteraceae bacterium]
MKLGEFQHSCLKARLLCLAVLATLAPWAANAAPVTIQLNEYPFPGSNTTIVDTNGSSSFSVAYNLIHDTTFASLPFDDGGLPDVIFDFAVGTTGSLGRSRVQWQTASSGRFTNIQGFQGAPGTNNPGSLNSAMTAITFGSHLLVTDVEAVFSSLNTAGISWEYAILGFLQPGGNPFSPMPVVSSYNSYPGFTGSPGQGWYVAASKGTVTGVGTSNTATGSSGPSNNFTMTLGSVGLAPGTPIGGLVFYSFVEDVRGMGNGNTELTSSLLQISFDAQANTSAIPEPSTLVLIGLPLLGLGLARRRAAQRHRC